VEESDFLEQLTRLVDDERVGTGEQVQDELEFFQSLQFYVLVFEELLTILEDR
jgi:hypothetical protein